MSGQLPSSNAHTNHLQIIRRRLLHNISSYLEELCEVFHKKHWGYFELVNCWVDNPQVASLVAPDCLWMFWSERQAICQRIHHYTTTTEYIGAREEVGMNRRHCTDARGLVTTVFLPSFTMSPLTVSIQFILDPASLPNSCGCIFVRWRCLSGALCSSQC